VIVGELSDPRDLTPAQPIRQLVGFARDWLGHEREIGDRDDAAGTSAIATERESVFDRSQESLRTLELRRLPGRTACRSSRAGLRRSAHRLVGRQAFPQRDRLKSSCESWRMSSSENPGRLSRAAPLQARFRASDLAPAVDATGQALLRAEQVRRELPVPGSASLDSRADPVCLPTRPVRWRPTTKKASTRPDSLAGLTGFELA
jgi:hypothetical protein